MSQSTAIPDRSRGAVSACLLCGNGDKIRTRYELSRSILMCEICELVYAEPISGDANPHNYSESYYREGVYADYLGDRPAIHKNAARTLARLERLVQGRTLLDVGCATGFFLEAARAKGWTVRGFESSEYASEYARHELQLPVETGSICAPPPGFPVFDVVTLWDTIEHLDRPDLALTNIHGLLHPQGLLVFSTGDYGSLLRRLTGKRWRLFADPTHNFFFNEATLRRLLRQTGYEIIRITREGKWVSLSMILHQCRLPFANRIRKWLGVRGFNPSLYVNLWDVVTIFARPITRLWQV